MKKRLHAAFMVMGIAFLLTGAVSCSDANNETGMSSTEGIGVQQISLSRYHLAYNDPDQTLTAVAMLANAGLIADDTVVKIQIKDTNEKVTNTVATLNKTLGTATATITVPKNSANSDLNGMTYTVLCKIGDEATDTTHTARFNVSAGPSLSGLSQSLNGLSYTGSMVQIPLSSVTGFTTEIIRIQGYNLDLTATCIQLYDSTGAAYFATPIAVATGTVAWTAISGSNCQTIDTIMNIPAAAGSYTVRILLDGVVQTGYSLALQVYDVPKFTSFAIPSLVSSAKEGSLVTAEIVGNNFDRPDVDLLNFTATCSSNPSIVANSSFTRNSDSSLFVTLTVPGTAGNYDITVKYGTQSITGTLKVKDFPACSVGDVLLSDGTIVRYKENPTFTDEQKSKAVGVMYFNEYGVPGWLGKYNSSGGTNSGTYPWTPEGTTGYNTRFTDMICTRSSRSSAASTATFTGDADGSDNWAYICSVDPVGTADAATNYPAFNYVNTYASTFGLTGDYAGGWYMPSIAELCHIYRNKDVLNTVLNALAGIQMSNGEYWSSSQYATFIDCAWLLPFSDGYFSFDSKSHNGYVCCVRAFNER